MNDCDDLTLKSINNCRNHRNSRTPMPQELKQSAGEWREMFIAMVVSKLVPLRHGEPLGDTIRVSQTHDS